MLSKLFKVIIIAAGIIVGIIILFALRIVLLEAPRLSTLDATRLNTAEGLPSSYYLDDGEIFTRSRSGTGLTKPRDTYLEGVDVESFQPLGSGMARDKSGVFYFEEKLNLDPETFKILFQNESISVADYVADKSGVYFIKSISENGYEFSHEAKLVTKEIEQFRPHKEIAGYYQTDTVLFRNGEQIISADPNTFETITNKWAADSDGIFCGSEYFGYKALTNYQINTAENELNPFTPSEDYARVADLVIYCQGPKFGPLVVKGAEIGSFVVEFNRVEESRTDAHDANWYYHKGKRVAKKSVTEKY